MIDDPKTSAEFNAQDINCLRIDSHNTGLIMQGFGTDFTLSMFMNKQPNCQLDYMNKQFNDMNKMYVDGVYSGISVSLAAVNWLMVLFVLQQYGNRIYQKISLAMTMPLIETMVVYFCLIYIYI